MRQRPHAERFIPETIESNELGPGLRIYTSHDDVYEARGVGNVLSRLYSDGDDWQTKVRLPVTAPATVANEVEEVTERLADTYDTSFDYSTDRIEDRVRADDGFSLRDDDYQFTIQFNPEDNVDIPESYMDVVGGVGMGATYVGAGAAVGFAIGGPAGAVAFGLPAAAVGAAGGLGAFAADQWIADAFDTNKTPTFYVMDKLKEGREETFRQKIPKNNDYWDRLNAGDDEVAAKHEEMMQKQFYQFEELQGLIVTAETDDYEEAAEMTGTVLGVSSVDLEEPTIYQSITAFKELFESLDRRDREGLLWQYYVDSDHEMGKHVRNYLKNEEDENGPYAAIVEEVADEYKKRIEKQSGPEDDS